MNEAEIRADERAKCIAEVEAQANEYLAKWGPIVGDDAAKAEAWNLLVAARRLSRLPDSASPEQTP